MFLDGQIPLKNVRKWTVNAIYSITKIRFWVVLGYLFYYNNYLFYYNK